MKKLIALSSLVLATGLAVPAVAFAQEPPALEVLPATVCGQVTLTAKVNKTFAENDTYEIAVFSGPNAGGEASKPEGTFFVSAQGGIITRTVKLPEDAHGNSAFVTWRTISGPNPEFYVSGVAAVNTDCAPPVEEPEPTPTAAPTPTPTTTPSPSQTSSATPTPSTSPAPVGDDGDFDQVGSVPVGGVATGGGPA